MMVFRKEKEVMVLTKKRLQWCCRSGPNGVFLCSILDMAGGWV